VKVIIHHSIVPRLRLVPYVFMAWCLIKAQVYLSVFYKVYHTLEVR
jgi:hypothetical protein